MQFTSCDQSKPIPEIPPAEVAGQLEDGALFVDVREPDEVRDLAYDLPGQVHLPLSELPHRYEELPRDRTIILACRSGNRSQKAGKILTDHGYDNLLNLTGGIKGWEQQGYPVDSSALYR